MFLKFFRDKKPDVKLAPGQILFNESEPADLAYIVESGLIELSVRGTELTTIMAEEIVGEMALVEDKRRFARATAGPKGASLHSIDKNDFLKLVVENPDFAIEVMKVMAGRLRKWGELFK
jgi:CRP-like cAMP-binding protein